MKPSKTRWNPIQPTKTQYNSVKPNKTQSNPVKLGFFLFKFLLAYWVLPSCIKCHQIWLGRSEVSLVVNLVFHFSSFRIWLGFSWFYWVLPSITGFFSIAARCERVSLVSSECCVFFYCFKKKKQIDWKKRGTIIELFPGFFVRVRPNRPPISASTCIDGSSEGCEGWKKKEKEKREKRNRNRGKAKRTKWRAQCAEDVSKVFSIGLYWVFFLFIGLLLGCFWGLDLDLDRVVFWVFLISAQF